MGLIMQVRIAHYRNLHRSGYTENRTTFRGFQSISSKRSTNSMHSGLSPANQSYFFSRSAQDFIQLPIDGIFFLYQSFSLLLYLIETLNTTIRITDTIAAASINNV
jgi:hypothetical protein